VINRNQAGKETRSYLKSGTVLAHTLYQQVNLSGLISFGKFYGRNSDIQTIGFPANGTFKMNVVMMVAGCGAGRGTQGVFYAPLVIKHFMN
jgi:hypothetical protein